MFTEENSSKITLLISLLFHLSIIAGFSIIKNPTLKKTPAGIEISYVSGSDVTRLIEKVYSKSQPQSERITLQALSTNKKFSEINPEGQLRVPDISKPREAIALEKPQASPQTQKMSKITLKNTFQDASKDPAYLSYRGKVRKKIEEKVYYYSERYYYFNNPQEGRIFIAFTIDSKGALLNFEVLDDRSSKNNLLNRIVRAAINSASPFDAFPPDLKYNQRTFNLEISFELE